MPPANTPSNWDIPLFLEDLSDHYQNKKLPLRQSDFPVPHYTNKGTGYRIGKHSVGENEYASIGCWTGS